MNPKFTKSDKSHPLYNTWWNMLARCYVPISPGFENYGGRGIRVSNEWQSFEKFCVDMQPKPSGMSLDRIDNDGDYTRENCKWSSRSDQMANRRQFGNNSSGETGVIRIVNRFEARFDYGGVRYRIGRFDTVIDAKKARDSFIKEFTINPELAILNVSKPTVWCTSDTKVRGISKHKDGGFVVRATRNGIRHYVGYFKTLEEARDARCEFDKS